MEEMYQTLRTMDDSPVNPPISPEYPPISPEYSLATTVPPSDYQNLLFSEAFSHRHRSDASFAPEFLVGEVDRARDAKTKARIASHPSYPRLIRAFIDCQKVGASPEIACLLDEIGRDRNDLCTSCCYGADPELDEFMEMFCGMLVKYKSDLARPFDEANTFLSKMETQLNNLCTGTVSISDEGAASSEEEPSVGGVEAQRSENPDIKDRLLRKFGSHIGTLKREFSKKKKKGKLPEEARQTLLEWWNIHYKWPYPTEADKIALAESTGLGQSQINNWFINQRKRHWKPSENLHLALMDNISSRFSTYD